MHLTRTVIVCLALALALAGCGRRGSLEPPPSTTAKPVDKPVTQEPSRPFQKKRVPERPFILDGLI